jgi:hypothetical protein
MPVPAVPPPPRQLFAAHHDRPGGCAGGRQFVHRIEARRERVVNGDVRGVPADGQLRDRDAVEGQGDHHASSRVRTPTTQQ